MQRCRLVCRILTLALLPCLYLTESSAPDTDFEMGSRISREVSRLLFVPPKLVTQERDEFLRQLQFTRRNRRALYERYLDVIGANGILDGIEHLWPKCHSQAHDLGKVIFARVRDVGSSLRICADRCHSGCMHGVLMGAFTDALDPSDPHDHPELKTVKPLITSICYDNPEMTASYSPGDCAHGVGHALMVLANYVIPTALAACEEFADPAMRYYCATGAYMEYVMERDQQDARYRSRFYPCDTFPYPAACFRYKMVHVVGRQKRSRQPLSTLIQACKELAGKYQLGCFHGLGNAYMRRIAHGRLSLVTVCQHGSPADQLMCIEGAMERMAKYHEGRAKQVCDALQGASKTICLTAVRHNMYNMQKDLSLYLAE